MVSQKDSDLHGPFFYNCLASDIFSIKRFILELAGSNHYTDNTCFQSLYHRRALSSTPSSLNQIKRGATFRLLDLA